MNLHWHIIITLSPSFTVGFILGVVHPMGLGKCIHHCSINTEYFYCHKNPMCCAYLSFPLPKSTLLLFMCGILSKAFYFLVSQFPHQLSKDNNNTCLKGVLWILKGLDDIVNLAQGLGVTQHNTTVTILLFNVLFQNKMKTFGKRAFRVLEMASPTEKNWILFWD